jgi:prepilin-type N-terminal cleavage/methylation domain-containing protein
MIPRDNNKQIMTSGGFTLLEVLVSSAVLAIVMAVMLSALSTSLSLWRNTDGKIAADREARAVELLLARDLANVVMPASTNLWPRIDTPRRSTVQVLKFLTAAPVEYQGGASNVGDVCYVEYTVAASTNGPGREVRRLFFGSSKTYTDVISPNAFPTIATNDPAYQSLGLNLLETNNMAARGLGPLIGEANNTNFVLLGTNMLPFTAATNNYPAAIEVNFSVADPATLANTNIIASSRYILRNAGLYSFRFPLPKPPNAP